MKVTKDSVSSTEVTLTIEMDSQDEDPFIDRSYRRSVGRLAIPGFRKGKAPRSIVETYVGRGALLQEALEFMIPETLDQVLRDEDLQAFVEPQVELTELEPVSFTAVVPLEPLVDLGDYQSIRVEQEPVEITDEQIDQVVERLREESTPWEPADRPVEYGDLLNLNVRGEIEGEEVVNDQGVDYMPQETNVLPFPGFAPFLEGLTESESKEFTLAIPEDYPRPQFAGKECQFQVEVLSVKEKKLPDLDDEFSKGVGDGFDTMDALIEHVRERLTEQAEAEARQELEIKSLEELITLATIQASDTLYQRELEMLQREQERMLQNQRLDMDTYLQYIGKTEEEFIDELRPTANDRLTRYLVMRKLSQEESIEVTAEEVESEIDGALESAGDNAAQLRRTLTSESARENIRSSLLNRKIIERLVEIVQGSGSTDEAPEAAETPEGEPVGESPSNETQEQPEASTPEVEPAGESPSNETQEQPEASTPEETPESNASESNEGA